MQGSVTETNIPARAEFLPFFLDANFKVLENIAIPASARRRSKVCACRQADSCGSGDWDVMSV
jgi:hypothetical protein